MENTGYRCGWWRARSTAPWSGPSAGCSRNTPASPCRNAWAATVAARVDTELLLFEAAQQQRRPTRRHDNAYALVLQAAPAIFRLDRDPFIDAGHVLEQAVTVERDSALAYGWLAYWYVFFVGQGWATNRFQAMIEGGRAAERAMMLDPKGRSCRGDRGPCQGVHQPPARRGARPA